MSSSTKISELISFYKKSKVKIRSRLKEFSKIHENQYFYELCFCLCTPQSNAKKCDIAVRDLKKKGFKNKKIKPNSSLMRNVRFHNNKSDYLVEMKEKFPLVLKQIKAMKKESKELREWLVKNVKGLGYKEASHFLRNIGFRGLAILDRHILKNMLKYSAVSHLPKTISKKEYLGLEEDFLKFSKKIGIDMDELDLLFWSMETGEIFK
ncbi:N-glycosylase/DNA lyase [candidate division KSB1 bacterium]